jgi:WD40 repeat protein
MLQPRRRTLVSGSVDGVVRIWDTRTGQQPLTLKGHKSEVCAVRFSPDGQRLTSVGYDKMVRLWDAVTGKEAFVLKGHTEWILGVCFSPDGKRLASPRGAWTGR